MKPSRRSQSGAFDLPSILIGVAVVAILAIGVMATIFGVIPWAQDRAAKQDLAAMNTAQGTVYARDGSFTDKATLVAAGWLGEGTPAALDAKADVEGKCYVAVTTAKTGNQFFISHDKPTPRELTASDTWCNGSRIMKDTAPVMVTIWDTSLADSCKEITLPLSSDFKGTVDWGDGSKGASTRHTFASAGKTEIRIDGTFSGWGSELWADAGCLVSVDRWGATGTTDLSYAFHSATKLEHVESTPPGTANFAFMFRGVTSDFTIGALDTSSATTMANMFSGATAFNQPVDFDTSRVTTMANMFSGATAFNQPVDFDTSKVTTMSYMFNHATAFNQPVEFDTSNVTTMATMFRFATAFNSPVHINTSKVTDMGDMFGETPAFNQPVDFNTSKVTAMDYMFSGAKAFNQPVEFDTSKVTDMNSMFDGASKFNQPLKFDTSRVTDMTYMFFAAPSFNQDLSSWDVRKVTNHNAFDSGHPAWTLPKPNWVH